MMLGGNARLHAWATTSTSSSSSGTDSGVAFIEGSTVNIEHFYTSRVAAEYRFRLDAAATGQPAPTHEEVEQHLEKLQQQEHDGGDDACEDEQVCFNFAIHVVVDHR